MRTDIETAEMVKYADNAWHALKVASPTRSATSARRRGVDSHEVMEIFCKDTKLNLSPYYLKPGLRLRRLVPAQGPAALVYKAQLARPRAAAAELDAAEQPAQIDRALDLIDRGQGKRKIGVLGFRFKAGTDDLRESPLVELIERLIGKGYDLRIYDANVNLSPRSSAPTATTS